MLRFYRPSGKSSLLWEQEVASSNPAAPTNTFNKLLKSAVSAAHETAHDGQGGLA